MKEIRRRRKKKANKDPIKQQSFNKTRRMLEKIKELFADKTRLKKVALIFSSVLFLFLACLTIWFAASRNQKAGQSGGPEAVQPALGGQNQVLEKKCDGCLRRALDGVYVKPKSADLPVTAVMIDNHPEARPAAGLEKAGLVYEAEVEGSYTRFMAVFSADEEVKEIGPVRSARPYFVEWAREMNAVYGHCGGSPEALVLISKYEISDLNEMYSGQYFWRAENRKAPHNILTSSANLNKFAENKKISNGGFLPWRYKSESASASASSSSDSIKIGYGKEDFLAEWTYDRADNDYIRYLGGVPELTAGRNLIIAKNIIIQRLPAEVVDDKLRLKMETVGSGTAIICLDGVCREGKWQKSDLNSRTRFYYEGDREVELNAGPTWVEVVRPEIKVSF